MRGNGSQWRATSPGNTLISTALVLYPSPLLPSFELGALTLVSPLRVAEETGGIGGDALARRFMPWIGNDTHSLQLGYAIPGDP